MPNDALVENALRIYSLAFIPMAFSTMLLFYYEGIELNFVKCFFCLLSDHGVFVLHSMDMIHYIIDFWMLKPCFFSFFLLNWGSNSNVFLLARLTRIFQAERTQQNQYPELWNSFRVVRDETRGQIVKIFFMPYLRSLDLILKIGEAIVSLLVEKKLTVWKDILATV